MVSRTVKSRAYSLKFGEKRGRRKVVRSGGIRGFNAGFNVLKAREKQHAAKGYLRKKCSDGAAFIIFLQSIVFG